MQSCDEKLLSLLGAVLDESLTYRAIASQLGVVRSTVERRVKRFVRAIYEAGLLGDHFQSEWIASLPEMRRERATIMKAARAFNAPRADRRRFVLDQQELAAGASRLRARSRSGDCDVALICTLFCTGLKPIELARLEVRDYLLEDGTVRAFSTLRAEAAVNGVARPLLFHSAVAVQSIDAYLAERVRRSLHAGDGDRYRSLDPRSRLFLTDSGKQFVVTSRSRSDPRPACKHLQATLRRAFARAGWAGMTAQQVRKHVALALNQSGADEEQMRQLLGLKSKRSVKRLTATAPQSCVASARQIG